MKKPYANSANSDLEIVQALAALVYASDWSKTYRVLERQQGLLLLDRALEWLNFTINELYLEGDVEDAQNWEQYERLLIDARLFGVQLAWESFTNTFSLNSEGGV